MNDDAIQDAMLRLIEACGHWNAFNGPAMALDLRANRGLWRTAILVGPSVKIYLDRNSGGYREEFDFSAHRDLPSHLLGYDVVQLTPVIGKEDELEALVNSWGADSVQWHDLPRAGTAVEDDDEAAYVLYGGDPRRVVLELWWD